MTGLVTHHFLFTTEVVTPIELDDHSGAALRGSLLEAVWKRFCNNKASPTCAACPLHGVCPVSALVAPLREEHPRGRDIPRPYIVLPPLGQARRYEPGKQLIFGLTLFGTIIQLLPYVMLSVDLLEAGGLGRKLDRGRGRFSVKKVESYHPFNGELQVIYEAGKPLVAMPTLSVTADDIATRAASLSKKSITVNFLTPTRLVDQEQVLRHLAFRPLIHRLLDRLCALEEEYGIGDSHRSLVECQELLQLAETIQCVDDATYWEEVQSYSHRQKRSLPISGFQGKATFVGNLEPFRELLAWGELVHIGKNVVKGNGWYKLEA